MTDIKVMKDGSLPWSIEQWQREQAKEQLAFFKEGEKIAARSKLQGTMAVEDLADCIMLEVINWYSIKTKKQIVMQVIKVYQGFLDGGGEVDFTKG